MGTGAERRGDATPVTSAHKVLNNNVVISVDELVREALFGNPVSA